MRQTDNIIIQVESKGKNIKIIKDKKSFVILDNQENDLNNVHFLKNVDALSMFNDKLSYII